MRFYLNFPLVAGYVLMATTACLGMLQLAAARGDYAGLSLFTSDPKRGAGLGAGVTVGALLAYVLFAPQIRTPGPAGTEAAEMFVICALLALGITLAGAHRRLQADEGPAAEAGERLTPGDLRATLHRPPTPRETTTPALVLLPDPAGFVTTSPAMTKALNQAGIAVLALDPQSVAKSEARFTRRTLLGHLSIALAQLDQLPGIDQRRVGLLGLGLGGDAVLAAAGRMSRVTAAVAVAPVGQSVPAVESGLRGLDWLHELSYLQAWRWRRQRSTLVRAAAELADPGDGIRETPLVVLQGCDDPLAAPGEGPETLAVPGRRRFRLLDDQRAQRATVAWFRERLGQNGGEG